MSEYKVKIKAIGKIFELEIPTKLYPSNLEFLEDPETTVEDKLDFIVNLIEVVKGNFDYLSSNRIVRAVFRDITRRLKNERQSYINKFVSDKERQSTGGKNSQNKQKIDTIDNQQFNGVALECDLSTTQVNRNRNNNINNNPLSSPLEGAKKGGEQKEADFVFFGDVIKALHRWGDLPEPNDFIVAYNAIDDRPEILEVCHAIANAQYESQRVDLSRALATDKDHVLRLPDRAGFKTLWNMAKKAISKRSDNTPLSQSEIETIDRFLFQHRNNERALEVVQRVVEDITKGKLKARNLESVLKANLEKQY